MLTLHNQSKHANSGTLTCCRNICRDSWLRIILEPWLVNSNLPGLCWAWGGTSPTAVTEEEVDTDMDGEEVGTVAAVDTDKAGCMARIEDCGTCCWAGWAAWSVELPSTVTHSPGWPWAMVAAPVLLLLGTPPGWGCRAGWRLTAGLSPSTWLSMVREFWIGMPCMTVWAWPETEWVCVWLWLWASETGIWKRVGVPIWPGWSWMGPERMCAPGWPCEVSTWPKLMFWFVVKIWLAMSCPPGPWLVMMWPPGCWVRICPPAWSCGRRNWWFWPCRTVWEGITMLPCWFNKCTLRGLPDGCAACCLNRVCWNWGPCVVAWVLRTTLEPGFPVKKATFWAVETGICCSPRALWASFCRVWGAGWDCCCCCCCLKSFGWMAPPWGGLGWMGVGVRWMITFCMIWPCVCVWGPIPELREVLPKPTSPAEAVIVTPLLLFVLLTQTAGPFKAGDPKAPLLLWIRSPPPEPPSPAWEPAPDTSGPDWCSW